jgi:hypothetical protein
MVPTGYGVAGACGLSCPAERHAAEAWAVAATVAAPVTGIDADGVLPRHLPARRPSFRQGVGTLFGGCDVLRCF